MSSFLIMIGTSQSVSRLNGHNSLLAVLERNCLKCSKDPNLSGQAHIVDAEVNLPVNRAHESNWPLQPVAIPADLEKLI